MYSEYELVKELKSLIPLKVPNIRNTDFYSKYVKCRLSPNNIYTFIELNKTSRKSLIEKYETFAFIHAVINNEERGDMSLSKIGVNFIDNLERIKTSNVEGIFVTSSSQPYFDKTKECWVKVFSVLIRWTSNPTRISNKFNDVIIKDFRFTNKSIINQKFKNDLTYTV